MRTWAAITDLILRASRMDIETGATGKVQVWIGHDISIPTKQSSKTLSSHGLPLYAFLNFK
jgi:hypothetical protein